MKKLLIIISAGLSLLLTSCSEMTARNSLTREFKVPPENIALLPGKVTEFIVKDIDGNIWYVHETGFDGSIKLESMDKLMIFNADKK